MGLSSQPAWTHFFFFLALACATAARAAEAAAGPVPDALTRDPAGWEDVLPAPDLKGWVDVPIPFNAKLTRAQWHRVGDTLVCDGDGGHDMLLLDRPLHDCIFHVEFCFKKIEGKKGYNSGVFIRTSRDGTFWHQAQVGSLNGGYWFGVTPDAAGQPKKFTVPSICHVTAAGNWNTFELTAKGRVLKLLVNGFPAGTFPDCGLDEGYVSLEGEHFAITFRHLKLKVLP